MTSTLDQVLAGALQEATANAALLPGGQPVLSEAQLRYWVENHLHIQIPDVQVCPNHTTPWRAFADAFFARNLVDIWKASRGLGGKTWLLSVLGDAEAVLLGADTTILGGSGDQSIRVQEYVGDLLKVEAPGVVIVDNAREIRLSNKARLRALMASSKSVRGPHPQRMRVDEVDELDLTLADAALGQPMSKRGIRENTVLSSTHHYPDATMTEMLRRAQTEHVGQWGVHEWCWRESHANGTGWLTQQQIDAKRGTVTKVMWDTEYDLQEPSSENRAIDPAKVVRMFTRELGEFDGGNGEYIEVQAPVQGGQYATGADWAKEQDWTIILTWRYDIFPYLLVAFERIGRQPWPQMVARLDERSKRYGGQAWHDATGLGNVVDGYLTTSAVPIIMKGRSRQDQISNYIGAIERGLFVAPFIKWMESEHRLASWDQCYGAGHLPDTISAGSLANLGVPQQWTGGAAQWIDMYRNLLNKNAGVDQSVSSGLVVPELVDVDKLNHDKLLQLRTGRMPAGARRL